MLERGLAALCDHLDVRVRNATQARQFYDAFCAALGLTVIHVGEQWIAYETPDTTDAFLAIASDTAFTPARTRIALRATSREEVRRIAAAAQAAGATEFEPPQDCPEYCEGYFASFFCDIDGNRYEVCYRPRA